MKTFLIIFGFLAQISFATVATAAGFVECTRPGDARVEKFTTADLQDCNDLKANTICEYIEGHDAFRAYAFDKKTLSAATAGDSVAGYYLEGLVFTTTLITSEKNIVCRVL